MRCTRAFSALVVSSIFFIQPAIAEEPWKLINESNGIKVYKKDEPNSPLYAFKGVKVIPAPIAKVAQVLFDNDVETRKEWIDMMVDFEVLEESRYQIIGYSSYDLPWPLADRDYVIQSDIEIDNTAGRVLMKMKSITHQDAPETVGVRAELVGSLYQLVPLSPHSTEATVEIQTDPKGRVPNWLANMVQKGWPANTLNKMEVQALKASTVDNALIMEEFTGVPELAQH